jgi:hypothetical protein
MRPVNADTASRLHCYNDYASGPMAPTSRTNCTFGEAPRHAQDQTVGRTARVARHPGSISAITIAFSDNQKSPNRPAFPIEGTWKPSSSHLGLALASITP